jgi:hypothetical protein
VLGATAMQNFAFWHYFTIKNLPTKLSGTAIGFVKAAAVRKNISKTYRTYSFVMLKSKNEKINYN